MWTVVGWDSTHLSVHLLSAELMEVSVVLPHVSQKEESIEQAEFHYDEFGFRVDKEGKTRPIPAPSTVCCRQPFPCLHVWHGETATILC